MPTKIEEEDQTRTGRPVKVKEHDIDFRVPGLSHAVVKEAKHLRVQELVKKIEQTKTGCNLYPGLRDQERRYPWCSTRQDRSTKRIPHGLECVEEMLQES